MKLQLVDLFRGAWDDVTRDPARHLLVEVLRVVGLTVVSGVGYVLVNFGGMGLFAVGTGGWLVATFLFLILTQHLKQLQSIGVALAVLGYEGGSIGLLALMVVATVGLVSLSYAVSEWARFRALAQSRPAPGDLVVVLVVALIGAVVLAIGSVTAFVPILFAGLAAILLLPALALGTPGFVALRGLRALRDQPGTVFVTTLVIGSASLLAPLVPFLGPVYMGALRLRAARALLAVD